MTWADHMGHSLSKKITQQNTANIFIIFLEVMIYVHVYIGPEKIVPLFSTTGQKNLVARSAKLFFWDV